MVEDRGLVVERVRAGDLKPVGEVTSDAASRLDAEVQDQNAPL
jgi:hypothetical protein